MTRGLGLSKVFAQETIICKRKLAERLKSD